MAQHQGLRRKEADTSSVSTRTAAIQRLATRLSRAETDLLRQQERFSGLLEASPDAIVVADGNGNILLVNEQAVTLFGYQRAELIGRGVDTLLPKNLRQSHHGHVATFAAEPRTRAMGADMDLCAQRKDGSEFPVEISLNPLPTENGMLVIAAIRDVSDRKRQEQALRESEQHYRVLVEEATDAIIIVKDGAVIYQNPF